MTTTLNIRLPEGWGEITPSLFVDYLRIRGASGEDAARIHIWKHYSEASYDQAVRDLDDADMADVLQAVVSALDWLYTPPVRSPIDRFSRGAYVVRRQQLYFSEEKMETSTLREFILADEAYTHIVRTMADPHAEGAADVVERQGLILLAILARPLSGDLAQYIQTGDRRIPIESEYHAHILADRITRRDRDVYIHTAILYFTGVKQYIFDSYGPHIFGSHEDGNTSADAIDLGWHSHTAAVAQQGVFGHHVEEVVETNLHRFLLHLVDENQKAERQRIASQKP